ncbi:hypothetical protein [Streptomyces sp. NPDC054849]
MKIDWDESVEGLKLEEYLALMDGVQGEVEFTQFEIRVRAEENLQRVKQDRKSRAAVSNTSIQTERGRVDRYVVLQDIATDEQAGKANSALSIELGRGAYDVTLLNPEGETVNEYTVGAMNGLYILTDAANLPRSRKGGSKVRRHVKIRQKKGGARRGRSSRRD